MCRCPRTSVPEARRQILSSFPRSSHPARGVKRPGRAAASTTLGEQLSLQDLDEHECYLAMNWLLGRQESMQKKLAKKHLADGGPVLFDLSSSYFEGHTCPLAKRGYSRDKRGLRFLGVTSSG